LSLLLLSLALVAVARDALSAEITVPSSVADHSLVIASTRTPGKTHTWVVIDQSGSHALMFEGRVSGNVTSTIAFTGVPGQYVVFLTVVDVQGNMSYAGSVVTIGGGPVPPPPPPPPPPPDQRWQIVFFHNSNDLDNYAPAQLSMLQGLKFRKSLVEKGHTFVGSYDVQSVPSVSSATGLAQWFSAVKGKSMPRVALAPKDGGTIQDFPLPENAADLLKLLENTSQERAKP
jgi:hypothetical protein